MLQNREAYNLRNTPLQTKLNLLTLLKLLFYFSMSYNTYSLVAKYAFSGQPCKNTPKRGYC